MPKESYWIINKKFLIILLGIMLIILYYITFHRHTITIYKTVSSKENCIQLEAKGIYNIPTTSSYYKPYLDGNRNGIACQKD